MNRVVTCVLAGAMALSLHSAAAWAQDEAPAAETAPTPLAETDPAEYVDLLAEGKEGEVMGIVFDVVLDGSGNATTVVVELFEDEPVAPAEGEEGDEAEMPDEGEGMTDTSEEEPEPLPAEDGEAPEGEGTEEPMFVGRLVGVSPKGAMLDSGRGIISFPSVTAAQAREKDEFVYDAGMKTVAYPEGYPGANADEE